MNLPGSVLGVLGMCWVVLRTQHSVRPRNSGPLGVCVGCVGFTRAGACVRIKKCTKIMVLRAAFFPTRGLEKPNTPNTPDTRLSSSLILLSFKCVGCVLGMAFLCWVEVSGGERGDD